MVETEEKNPPPYFQFLLKKEDEMIEKVTQKNSDVTKMRDEEKIEEWERKPLKKRWIIPHFNDVTC